MANAFKLTDDDERFLQIPHEGALIFAGASGTETWIERERDAVVRIGVKAVGFALANGAVLGVVIEVGDATAHGEDGPALPEAVLRATQSVEVLVRAGERLNFKAYAKPEGVQLLRTVVWAMDVPAAVDQKEASRQSGHAPVAGEPRSVEQRTGEPRAQA